MPIRRRAREPGHLEREQRAHASLRHILGEPLKPAAPSRAGAALAQILVDHLDLILAPAELDRASSQSVLTISRLTMLVELLQRRLPEVHDRSSLEMRPLDLVVHESPRRRARRWRARPCAPASPAHRSRCVVPSETARVVPDAAAVASRSDTDLVASIGADPARSTFSSSIVRTARPNRIKPVIDSRTTRPPIC